VIRTFFLPPLLFMLNLSLYSFQLFCYCWIILALLTFVVLFFVQQPYGRHARKGFGPMIDNKIGWIIMEAISPIVFNLFFFTGKVPFTSIHWIYFGLYNFHYINRSFIFPLRIKTKGKKMPISIVLAAIFFNSVNGFVNGYYASNFQYSKTSVFLMIVGCTLFILGFYINNKSDHLLIQLRKENPNEYKIPRGFLFEKITCPNYFGEIIEWLGFFFITFNIASFSFLIWTAANLIPRARDHHKWYMKQFSDYPKNRKIIIPFIF